jgi:SSS family solute:Na+ symporter
MRAPPGPADGSADRTCFSGRVCPRSLAFAPGAFPMQPFDYVAVVAYLAVTMLIVYRSSRKQDDTENFFLGGRSMPWFAVGLSIMATLLSTNTYLGVPGEMIRYGPAYIIGYIAYPLAAVVVILAWIPFFMRLRMTSAYEYLERRYDYRARFLGGFLFLAMRLGWMSMVVFTASRAMVAMVDEPLVRLADWLGAAHPIYPVIVAVGVAATIYACMGGIRAVIWTDVLQAVMLFGGVFLIIGYVAWKQGTGLQTWWSTIVARSTIPPQIKTFSWDITERTTILGATFATLSWNLCTHCSDQLVLQRYFTTSSLKAARNSFIVNIVSAATIGLLLAIAGLALRYFYLEHPHLLGDRLTPESGADDLMPFFYAHQLPAGCCGLILVGFLCDVLQTLVSGVNSISAVITRDVTERLADGGRRGDMVLARLVTVGVGIVATLLAVLAATFAMRSGKTIFDMLPRMFNMFLGPLASMFILGMFCRRVTAGVIVPTVLIAQLFSFLWSWWGEMPWLFSLVGLNSLADAWSQILGVNADGKLRTPSIMLSIGVPCLFGIMTGWFLGLLAGRREHPGAAFTWRAVLSRSTENV